jgi:L-threonylcarbamoyladenylate synthase
MPRIVSPTSEHIARAAAILREGGLVVMPTETVYGLGADTFNLHAIERVYTLKGRPANNPLIAHVANAAVAKSLVADWDDRCQRLADHFWPGPLTLVMAKADAVSHQSTAGYSTIAVRCPAHPAAMQLLQAFGGPISAPSANRSGRVSPTSARHVADDFAEESDLFILDGGPCDLGIESTVLDLSGPKPRILRPGSVNAEQLQGILEASNSPESLSGVEEPAMSGPSASPGTSSLHYAPRTPAELVDQFELRHRLDQEDDGPYAVICFSPAFVKPPNQPIGMPRRADQYARRMYDALRQADGLGCARILIELPPSNNGLWLAVHDRLKRATGQSII